MPKILLIDDEEVNDMIFLHILEKKGDIDYHYESDGWKALQYLNRAETEKSFPNLIFVDLKMPQMDGFSFIQYYEKRFFHTFSKTKLFILTSSILQKDKEKSSNYPSVINFMSKPITEDKLMQIITQFWVS